MKPLYLSLASLVSTMMAKGDIPQPWRYNPGLGKWETTDHWAIGANFIPSSAVNQLEMWQLDTWDPTTIERELRFASSLGMNAMRVFLHDLMWKEEDTKFLDTVDSFLRIAEENNIGILFVIFDSCWNAFPEQGDQPEPIPYVHNSRWLQSPGYDKIQNIDEFLALEGYVTGLLSRYKNDSRIIGWDLWNEPDNSGYKPEDIASLLSYVFRWARRVNPSQPLTSCLWRFGPWGNLEELNDLERLCVLESDVISFHNYANLTDLASMATSLKGYDKPIVCTEYMAREQNSTFDPNLGYLKKENISAFNWGVVSGRTQTIYPWDSTEIPNPYVGIDDPDPWFHDIFRQDGTARFEDEIVYIKSLTGAP